MREIEVKAKLHDKPAVLAHLREQGVELSEPIIQHDQVFGPKGVDGDDGNNHAPWLRIRTETKNGSTRHLFTLKKSVTNQLDSIEHETEVANSNELVKIITHLDFTPYSNVTKIRQKAMFGDVEVCVDTVEGLGDFIELEKLTADNADYEKVASELWNIFQQIGVQKNDEVTKGYDVLAKQQESAL
jgi:adenylate cyclase, class 2